MTLAITIILSLLLYGYLLLFWNRKQHWRFSLKYSKKIKRLHYGALILCVVVGIFNLQFNIGLRGLWTSRTFILVVLITGLIIPFGIDKTVLNKASRIYFKIFSWLPIISIAIVLMLPFLGRVLLITIAGRLLNPYDKIYYQDDKLRVQSTFLGALGPPRMDIYEKGFIMEKLWFRSDFPAFGIDSAKVYYDKDSTRVFVYSAEFLPDKVKIIAIKKIK